MSDMMEEVQIERWFYTKPNLIPNKEGNIVLISKKSFGPLEIYEWGINQDQNAYELYSWLENDFYKDESYCIDIEMERLLEQIQSVVALFQTNGLPKWVDFYETLIERLRNAALNDPFRIIK